MPEGCGSAIGPLSTAHTPLLGRTRVQSLATRYHTVAPSRPPARLYWAEMVTPEGVAAKALSGSSAMISLSVAVDIAKACKVLPSR